MSSVIEGYNYDIFISYRQKDNKYDGWVTEFVDNLKRELDSMFKEEVTVYYDINPHDGLLETHDVQESLKEKLKCLICIPIVSRTYCDPNSFAWKNEFLAFIEQASHDQFGLKVRLPNGNVAGRILPIRIHDLDNGDIKLFESTTGGALRPVDFIYKETGVNRQLRAIDDRIIKSPGHALYRDQINKVALAIRDIMESMKFTVTAEIVTGSESKAERKAVENEDLPEEPVLIEGTGNKAGTVSPEQDSQKSTMPSSSSKKVILPAIILGLSLCVAAFIILNHRTKVRWAVENALPGIEKFYDAENYAEAFKLTLKAEKYIPDNIDLKEWLRKVVRRLTVLTDPPGAEIFMRKYSDTVGVWQKLGKTPVDSVKVPVATFYRVKIEKPGYETVFAMIWTGTDTLSRKLFKQGAIPSGMVYVDGYWDEVKNISETDKGFFLDKYEVTNKQYKEFIDKGGYTNPRYWKQDFLKAGKKLSWHEAMAEFTDKTGRPGPSTWEAGDYPEGQDNYPVSGVSWYEAVAYAEFAGKVIPTGDHWDSGAGFSESSVLNFAGPEIFPLSNFNGKGTTTVGQKDNRSCYGAFDMAGNVREWNWNETTSGRIISGGGWSDESYMFTEWSQLPPFDRSSMNGFRCALYPEKEKIPSTAFRFIEMALRGRMDYSQVTPVPENIFRIYRNQFLYDKTALNSKIEKIDESPEDWIIEKVTFDAAYGNDRMIVYLFLPRNTKPPFQTLIFFPGSYAIDARELGMGTNVNSYLDYVIKSGRAVAYPVYFRTYERNDGKNDYYPSESHQYTEVLIKWVKDFSRTIDYLETRTDIDTGKLGFYGHSWGGRLAGIIPAVDNRLAVNIVLVGGLSNTKPYPEADGINYVPRIIIPTLMLNGRYDASFPLEKSVMPFFKNLGTPEADKRLLLYETGHYVSKSERTKEILNWCDKYLGTVKKESQ
jgi:dienelactone hydrolase